MATPARRLVETARNALTLGNLDQAVTLLERALRRHLESPEVYTLLARAQLCESQLDVAELTLQTGLLTFPHSSQLRLDLARTLLWNGNSLNAAELLMDLISELPKPAAAWYELGRLHSGSGDLDEAEAAFQRAHRLEPAVCRYRLGLAGIAFLKQDATQLTHWLEMANDATASADDFDLACLLAAYNDGSELIAKHLNNIRYCPLTLRMTKTDPFLKLWASGQ